ncbi:MAG: Cell division protein ftsA [Candidatus Woesebacteria bacterium GW2011_GWB1_38_5b]|uniref:Cell division protein FtsA n=1 Tax=Candidatus Woesebacteria bacterium GW2011_GWB1_38_5b TaxID=1618569 RepID=A0A0G0K8G4_9BACT|nr:MAG: Cell division protein ftsA [Candidatus Woesebacteria bacterium GW2011_GWB1_38_5b]
MTKNKIIAAIDIGSFKIATLIAQVSVDPMTYETSVNIVGATSSPSKGVKKGQIVDIEDSVEAVIASVEAAERMAGYNLDHAFVSVGGSHIASQNSTGVVAVSNPDGEINAGDVARVIEAARAISYPVSREIIHVLPRQFLVDGESGVRDPVGMTGVRLEVETHLVTASSAAIKNLAKTINEVGVDIEELVYTGLAASEATLSDTEKELGCVLIDLGAGTTSIAAFVDGALSVSTSIPIGARNVTNDLAIGLRVSLDLAEEIKLMLSDKQGQKDTKSDQIDITESGASEVKKVSRRTLVEGIVRPRLNEIFTMVRLELERQGIINKIPSGAILTGGGALTVGVTESAKRILGLPVRVAQPGGVKGLIDDIMTPGFSTAVGLILYAVSRSQAEKNQTDSKRINLPTKNVKGFLHKVIATIKDLLP